MSRKSPPSTEAALPHNTRAAGMPRRVRPSSSTSSCSSVAACTSSAACASLVIDARVVVQSARDARRARDDRITKQRPHPLAAGADEVARRAAGQPGAAVGERGQAVLDVGDDVADEQLERAEPRVHRVRIGSAPCRFRQSLGGCRQLRLCSHVRCPQTFKNF